MLLNRRGSALIIVLLSFVGILALLFGMMTLSMTNQANTLKTSDYAKAYTIAETGLNIRVAQFEDLFTTAAQGNPETSALFAYLETEFAHLPNEITFPETADDDKAVLTLSYGSGTQDYPGYYFYKITRTGIVNGTQRSLSKEVGLAYTRTGPGLIIGKAILTQRDIVIDANGPQVIGPMGSNVLDNSQITVGSSQTSDLTRAVVPTGKTASVVKPQNLKGGVSTVDMPFVFPTIVYPTIPDTASLKALTMPAYVSYRATLGVSVNSYLETLTVPTGSTLVVDLGSRGLPTTRKILKVKNLDIQGNLRVIGTGRLLLVYEYGNGTLNMGSKFNVCGNVTGSCLTTNPDFTKFLFYLRTPYIAPGAVASYQTITFSNLMLFYGSILAEQVNVDVKSSNFKGHIVTAGDFVNFQANAVIERALFYLPFGKLTIDSNSVLSGSLVGNTVEVKSPHTTVTYVEVSKESFPFTIDFPTTETSATVPGSASVIEGAITE